MKVQDNVQLCGRLALANEKAAAELDIFLDKWVQKHFVKGSSIQALSVLRSSGALPSLQSWLQSRSSDADVLAIIRKVDPNNRDILTTSAGRMIEHVDALARGTAPVPKPKPAKQPKSGGSKTRR